MKNQNLTVVQALPQAHSAGREIATRIIRNNVEIGYLNQNKFFNHNYRKSYSLNPRVKLTKVSLN